MFDDLSLESKKVFELMETLNRNCYGTKDLLWGLINVENSMFKYILDEYKISKDEINERIMSAVIISQTNEKYTKKLLDVIESAKKISQVDRSDFIYDEHLIYTILLKKENEEHEILEEFINDNKILSNEYGSIFDLDNKNTILYNMTKDIKDKKINPFIGRDELVDRVIRVLNKKQKNNPLLIGNAGVGKSSLVEKVASVYYKYHPEYTFYRLDLGLVIAGTKYRGDLEERILGIIEKVKKPYTILFIDEIHNIIQSGSNENAMDISNILKPVLSRNEITCIGATTIEEYYKSIAKDKALSRRFHNVFIEEASLKEVKTILLGIKKEYEKYHHVKYSEEVIDYLIDKSELITNRYFPDKAIDLLDEVGLYSKKKKKKTVSFLDVDEVVFESLGLNYQKVKDGILKIKYYPQLKNFYQHYLFKAIKRKNVMVVQTLNEESTNNLLEDLKIVFNAKKEMILSVDLSRYTDYHQASDLFGSSKGYVGYETGGLIFEHLNSYPLNIIIFKNLSRAHASIQNQIETLIELSEAYDSKSRLVKLTNSIIIIENEDNKKIIGFLGEEVNTSRGCIDYILPITTATYDDKINNMIDSINKHGYKFNLKAKDINLKQYKKIEMMLVNINEYEENIEYYIDLVGEEAVIIRQ